MICFQLFHMLFQMCVDCVDTCTRGVHELVCRCEHVRASDEDVARQKAALGDKFYAGSDNLDYGTAPDIPEANLDRMVGELEDKRQRAKNFSRRRSVHTLFCLYFIYIPTPYCICAPLVCHICSPSMYTIGHSTRRQMWTTSISGMLTSTRKLTVTLVSTLKRSRLTLRGAPHFNGQQTMKTSKLILVLVVLFFFSGGASLIK